MTGVVITLCIFGLAVLVSYIVVSGWKQTKADAEAEAARDFEFLKGIQKKYGFSDYNLWRLCQVYYDTDIIPEEKRHDPEAVYISFSFRLAELLFDSKDEEKIEVETGLQCKTLGTEPGKVYTQAGLIAVKANVIDYILVREKLYSIKEHNEAFVAFLDRPRGACGTHSKHTIYYYDESSQAMVKELCDSGITNPKCLLLQMEQNNQEVSK
ncbi:MAG: hypothetical protein LIO49_05995 [Ruminococcus sp.]|nr:hypothetical protein [Ruminococcus sp.]